MQIFLDACIHKKEMDIWYTTNHEYAKSIGAEQTLTLDRYRDSKYSKEKTHNPADSNTAPALK